MEFKDLFNEKGGYIDTNSATFNHDENNNAEVELKVQHAVDFIETTSKELRDHQATMMKAETDICEVQELIKASKNNISSFKPEGNVFDPIAAESIRRKVDRINKKYGIFHDLSEFISKESIGDGTSHLRNNIATESLSERIKAAMASIWEFIKKWSIRLFNFIDDGFDRLRTIEELVDETIKRVENTDFRNKETVTIKQPDIMHSIYNYEVVDSTVLTDYTGRIKSAVPVSIKFFEIVNGRFNQFLGVTGDEKANVGVEEYMKATLSRAIGDIRSSVGSKEKPLPGGVYLEVVNELDIKIQKNKPTVTEGTLETTNKNTIIGILKDVKSLHTDINKFKHFLKHSWKNLEDGLAEAEKEFQKGTANPDPKLYEHIKKSFKFYGSLESEFAGVLYTSLAKHSRGIVSYSNSVMSYQGTEQ